MSLLRLFSNLLAVTWLALLLAATVESHRDVSLAGIEGIGSQSRQQVPDLLDRVEQAIWRRNAPLELSETDVNRYLEVAIVGKQHGLSSAVAAFERVALDFHGGEAGRPPFCRAWLFWNTGGGRAAASLDFTLKREPQQFVIEPRRGSLGRLPVFRGALAVLVPGLRSLCGALDDEIHAVFQMNQVRFEENKVILDPRFDTGP